MPTTYDITCYRGVSFSQKFIWKDSSHTPVDLTAYTAQMQLRLHARAPEQALELSTANGRAQVQPQGEVTLSLSAADSLSIPAAPYVYDLHLHAPDGTVHQLVHGRFHLKESPTR